MMIPKQLFTNVNEISIVIAIDGFCGSGKTTLANWLQHYLEKNSISCNVISMDDFFLPLELRTKERLEQPGGNIHYERFLNQVLLPLKQLNEDCISHFSYYPFECSHMGFSSSPTIIHKKMVTIIEGVYCMRPEFRSFYDYTIFMTISEELQKERIMARNGSVMFHKFESTWIPMEHLYFDYYKIPNCCNQVICGNFELSTLEDRALFL